MEVFNQLNSEAAANGAEFVGSVVFLSVAQSTSIKLGNMVNAMRANPAIPDAWIPEPLNHVALYLQIISSMNRASLAKFNNPGQNILPDTHAGYSVHRLYLRREDAMPTSHKVFALKKVPGPDGKLLDVETDAGIIVTLRRTLGDASTDKTGQSEFSIDVQGYMTAEYDVFVDTLIKTFNAARDQFYGAEQIRTMIVDILRNQLKATPIKRGDYFIDGREINAMEALRDVFKTLDEGVSINPLHIVKFVNAPTLNQSFNSLAQSVQESVLKEMQDFVDELNHLDTKESKTRAGTWESRHDRFMDLQLKVKRMQAKTLIEGDILLDLADQAKEILSRCDEAE
jgi:hypothetical protein